MLYGRPGGKSFDLPYTVSDIKGFMVRHDTAINALWFLAEKR